MKKLLIAVPLICALFFNSSCKKDVETETIYITDTLTVLQDKSVAIYLEPVKQDYYSYDNSWAIYSTVDYSATNLGEKKISTLKVNFEAKTEDGGTYTSSDYIFDLEVGSNVNSQALISVASKKCTSVKVKSLEITTE